MTLRNVKMSVSVVRVLTRAACCAFLILPIAGIVAARQASAPVPAPPPEVERLASEAVKKIAKRKVHSFLTAPRESCFSVQELCDQLDTALHSELAAKFPGAQFIPREEAMKYLAKDGFLGIDVYLGALDDVASDAGADVVLSEDFRRTGRDCELRVKISDAKDLVFQDLNVRMACPAPGNFTYTLLKDTRTGAAIVVPLPQSPNIRQAQDQSKLQAPHCAKKDDCPLPRYSNNARRQRIEGKVLILITVTELGTVDNPRILGAVEGSLAQASLNAVSQWRLTPAVGPDGKIFAARVPIELNFSLR